MSEPIERVTGGPDAGAGRFWGQYVTAGLARERSRAAPEPEAPPAPTSDPCSTDDALHECLEWCPLCRGAELLRAGAAPELRGQLHTVQRDSLIMLRALIDTYLQRGPAEADPGATGAQDTSGS